MLDDLKTTLRRCWQTTETFLDDAKQLLVKPQPVGRNFQIKLIHLATTNICNAACVFCSYRIPEANQGAKGFMPLETAKKAVDDYCEMGGGTVSFTPIVGDALMDPGLIDKIKYAKSKPEVTHTYLYTNGINLLKDDFYKQLIDVGISEICVSMAEPIKENWEKVMGSVQYQRTMDGIYKLLEHNKACGEPAKISICFRSSISPSETLETPDFKKYIKPFLSDKVITDFNPNYDNWGGSIKQNDLVGVMKLRRIPQVKRTPCWRVFVPTVLYNGDVRLCDTRFAKSCFDELVAGNIHKNSLREIIYSPAADSIRNSFGIGVLKESCKDCSRYEALTPKRSEHCVEFH